MAHSRAEKELRIGLVLYGGVSLCIYIYGVAYEFLRLARRDGPYKELADKAGVKPVIDIISGTSAGGINGLFLAKALTTGASLDSLKELWISEGDLEGLIDIKRKDPPSLLDSDYYIGKLEEALRVMGDSVDTEREAQELLDLFITATDLDGVLDQLVDPLGTRIDTKQHACVFHFRARPGDYPLAKGRPLSQAIQDAIAAGRSESRPFAGAERDCDRLLAKVAASTSAFPVAFAPVRFEPKEKRRMRELFGEHMFTRGAEQASVFGDGGMVDNYPFGYTIEAMFGRQADCPVDRKLFFIEPDPAGLTGKSRVADRGPPRPSADGFDSLTGFFQAKLYESIANDLQRVVARNGRIAQIRDTVAALEKGVTAFIAAHPDLRKGYEASPLHLSYQRLKARHLKDELVARLRAKASEALDERHLDALFALEEKDPDCCAEFLRDFDYRFRVRRIRHFIKRVNRWFDTHPDMKAEEREQLGSLKAQLYSHVEVYLQEVRASWSAVERVRNDNLVRVFGDVRKRFKAMMQEPSKAEVRAAVQRLDALRPRYDSDAPEFAGLFNAYEYLDMHTYPVQVLANVGEADPIEVVRVSPDAAGRYKAAINAVQEKLAGEKFLHFSGFLKRAWRENDIIWGRLDAAEIIVRTLLANKDGSERLGSEAKDILDRLCPGIIADELSQIRRRRRGDIDRTLFSDGEQRVIKEVLEELDQLKYDDAEKCFRDQYTVGREALTDLPLDYVLRTSTKALRTFGRMLRRVPKKLPEAPGRIVVKPVNVLNALFGMIYYVPPALEKIGCLRGGRNVLCYAILVLVLLLAVVIILF